VKTVRNDQIYGYFVTLATAELLKTTQTKLDELSTRDQAETSALTVIVIFHLSADKIDFVARRDISWWSSKLEFGAYGVLLHSFGKVSIKKPQSDTMAVAAAQKSREMFAINKSYSIENGYPARRRSLVDDARFETIVVKQTKQSVLEEARQLANG